MSEKVYLLAVASSDGINIDKGFGEATEFLIYKVEGKEYSYQGKRKYSVLQNASKCGNGAGCEKEHGRGNGCGGAGSPKVLFLDDCRCVICSKIGPGIQKAFERRGISTFDIECPVDTALAKIVDYIDRTEKHISLIGINRK